MKNELLNIIKEPHVNFIQVNDGTTLPNIWHLLQAGLWRSASVEAFEFNNLKGVLKRNEWKPLFKEVIPLYPGIIWDNNLRKTKENTFTPKLFEVNWETVIETAKTFFNKFEGKKIGVQLSGGLDSSIIIGLLNYLKIPFWLVGMTTNRYEFRTEKHIQHLLIPLAQDTILIDYDEYLPLSNLLNVPAHQHPKLLSINYNSENAMALACKKLGIEVLLTGDGGDNLFAEELPDNPNYCPWLPQVFNDPWLADLIYNLQGVQLVPFFADEGFMNCIYNLRLGKREDNSKWWARKYFERILPQELVNYNYCADFWGLYISGLQNAIPTIQQLFKQAYHLTNDKAFSDKEFEKLLNQDLLNAKKEMYQVIEARTAFAIWLNSLKKVDGVV